MENFEETLKRAGKIISRWGRRFLFPIIAIMCIVVILFAGAVYFITLDDGTYKEDDWSSTPYAASEFVNNTEIEEDGTVKTNTTAEELWNKMLENGSRVNEYLDSPEELARLMRAEIVTQYPDTRKDPDEEIDWDEIVKGDTLQGIIKFKRANSDGTKTTLSYVSPETFQGYIDEYKSTGSESAKNNALSHFTLRKSAGSTSEGNGGKVAAGDGVMTDISEKIVNAINSTPWPGAMLCAQWVDDVYANAGVTPCRHGTAFLTWKEHCISTDQSAIPVGAAVFGTGQGSAGCGHIGIYIGDGKVADSIDSGIQITTLENWIAQQTDVIEGHQGFLGWGWEDNNRIRGTTEDPNVSQSDKKDDDEEDDKEEDSDDESYDGETAIAVPASGDGYIEEYISSAKIRYKDYKQIMGSYMNNPYWGGDILYYGCGPTAVAALASGLIENSTYTPADIAEEMNSKYGYTGPEPLKGEMDSLGMASEIIMSPTAQQIQDNLRNGKVMLVSVTPDTIFTDEGHIMSIVDINEQGQVYILNPSSTTLNGWYDVSEIMKGCTYIITTDAGAAGIAKSTNNSDYVAVVATWKQIVTTVESDDPDVEPYEEIQYIMTTSDINYEEMVEPFTMPFDLLWALLVVGENKDFVFDLADLVYDSDLEITVFDNLTMNTDVDEWTYALRTRVDVNSRITAKCGDIEEVGVVKTHTHDPWGEDKNFSTVKTVATQTNTMNAILTRANVWILDYRNDYIFEEEEEETSDPKDNPQEDGEYTESYLSEIDNSFSCEEIEEEKNRLKQVVRQKYLATHTSTTNNTSSTGASIPTPTITTYTGVQYFSKYVDINDKTTNTTATNKYIAGVPELKEKTNKDTEPNFVTIFNDGKYRRNKTNIKSASEWLFEILEKNDSTKEMVDLIKYLLYKATGVSYGIEEFDFGVFFPGALTNVGAGDYIVDTTKSSKDIVITDLDTLKKAFSGYSKDQYLQQYAYFFLECQEKYNVNAVFAAAVAIQESQAGTNIAIGGNNMFSISNGGQGNWNSYNSMESSIEAFYKLISTEYFTNQQNTVESIGKGNPEGEHQYCVPPEDWIKYVCGFMTDMFNAAGVKISSSSGETSEKGKIIIEAAKEKLNCPYVLGASGPDSFDCSGLTMWCYKKAGISLPHNSESQKTAAKKVVAVSEARPGDILWTSGHVGIYVGNGQYIHAPEPGKTVTVATNINYFSKALQFF